MKKTGVVLCSRSDSSRVPKKIFKNINGVPLIEHLLSRLSKLDCTVVLAIPEDQRNEYFYLSGKFDLKIACGYGNDPLARMFYAAEKHDLDTIIRVTHDKIFIESELVKKALDDFHAKGGNYLYSDSFTDGSAFEIIDRKLLEKAHQKYSRIEYIGYAVKSLATNPINFSVPPEYQSKYRFLLDYESDFDLLDVLFRITGNDCGLLDAIAFMKLQPWAEKVNALPKVTVYTCVYNGDMYLDQCMRSVADQSIFEECEYIIVDDCSSDMTSLIATKFKTKYKNVRIIRNESNIGLAGSSNVALSNAKGKYIVRLDSDDYFTTNFALQDLYKEAEYTKKDAVYPDNYYGLLKRIQKGNEQMHVGGAIFRTKILNHIKFTDKLRGFDGLDFYERAKGQMQIGFLNRPVFFYRQRPNSMSKTNLEERRKLKEMVTNQVI